jgi:hypothetical protein
MRWVRLLGSVFILAGGIVSARSANEAAYALETCFKAARIAPTRSAPSCETIPRCDGIAIRRRTPLNSSAWSTCCRKRRPDPQRQKLPPRLPGRNHLPVPHPRRQKLRPRPRSRNHLPVPHYRKVLQNGSRHPAKPVHWKRLLKFLRLKNPIARRRRLSDVDAR